MPAGKIVIVDDEPDAIEFCRLIIQDKYEVIGETNSFKAFDLILKENPDLVIMDLRMPVVDGFKLFDKLKEHEQTLRTPVLFMTASTRDDDLPDKFWQQTLGCDAFLTKPFEPYQLLQAIEKIFTKKLKKKSPTTGGGYF